MFLLYDNEIRLLAIQAEKSLRVQKQIQELSIFKKINKIEFLEETPEAFALDTLKQSHLHYLDGDVERLVKAIAKNFKDNDWYNNQC